LFREGRTKGLGIVTGLGYDKNKPLNAEVAKQRELEMKGVTDKKSKQAKGTNGTV